MTFNFRIKQLELRSCTEQLLINGEHTTAEIVKWWNNKNEKPSCYTLAYWKKDKEGFYLTFVGDRPFDPDVDKDNFWLLAKQGQQLLDIKFRIDESNE